MTALSKRNLKMEITTRAEAKLLSMTKYFTGEPCVNGHVAFRYTQSGTCEACLRSHTPTPSAEFNPKVREKIKMLMLRAKELRNLERARIQNVNRLRSSMIAESESRIMNKHKLLEFETVKIPVHICDIARVRDIIHGYALIHDITLKLTDVWISERATDQVLYKVRVHHADKNTILQEIDLIYADTAKRIGNVKPASKEEVAARLKAPVEEELERGEGSIFDVADPNFMS
jgi:hypothetical protein